MSRALRRGLLALALAALPSLAGVTALPATASTTPVAPVGVCATDPAPTPPSTPPSPCMNPGTGLGTSTLLTGLTTPIGLAFPAEDEVFVLEKNTGRVQHVVDGAVRPVPALDLAVNYASERGLLGIALHPSFGSRDCTAARTPRSCSVYLNWVESSTGQDTAALWETPLLGHRVDRYLWDGTTLRHDSLIQRLRAYQKDYNQPATTAIARPAAAPTLAAGGTGTLAAGTYTVGVTYYRDERPRTGTGAGAFTLTSTAQQETALSATATVTVPAGGSGMTVTVPPPPGATPQTGVRVYVQQGLDPKGEPEMLRVAQADFPAAGDATVPVAGPPAATAQSAPPYLLRGNHNGGVMRFGRDGKLYVYQGDAGRRGWMQNLRNGPGTAADPNEICADHGLPATCDDQFGGPEPDDAHLTGVVLRLNTDGSAPRDNPLWEASRDFRGEVRANLRKVWSYGHRNGFGMTVDPRRGNLWAQENGDDTFSELNHLGAGTNSGWVQIMGPRNRVDEFRTLELGFPAPGQGALQQLRWSPANIATSSEQAQRRLVLFEGARYSGPEFSWRWEVAPGGLGFGTRALGRQYDGDLFMGAATPQLQGGYLMRFDIASGRRDRVAVTDAAIRDRVADNTAKHDGTESGTLIVGRNFGVAPDVAPAPDGSLYVVSLVRGTVERVFRQQS